LLFGFVDDSFNSVALLLCCFVGCLSAYGCLLFWQWFLLLSCFLVGGYVVFCFDVCYILIVIRLFCVVTYLIDLSYGCCLWCFCLGRLLLCLVGCVTVVVIVLLFFLCSFRLLLIVRLLVYNRFTIVVFCDALVFCVWCGLFCTFGVFECDICGFACCVWFWLLIVLHFVVLFCWICLVGVVLSTAGCCLRT